MAAAVLVLQAFAAQRGAAGGGAEQEASGALVGRCPDLVANALKAKHRVINVEGQHGQAVHAVAGGGGRPARQCASFADALFQNLPVQCFPVAQHRADVFGRVTLANAGVNANLLEQVGHAESAGFVRHDGHDARAQRAVFEQATEQPHKGHGGAHFLAVCCQREAAVRWQRRNVDGLGRGVALGQVAAERCTLGLHVLHFGAVCGGAVKINALGLLVAQRQVEAIAKLDEFVFGKLLL